MKKEEQESCFSTPSSSTASRPQLVKRAPPLTNLRRLQGHAAGFLSLTHKRDSIDQHGEQESRNAESGVNCSIDENSEDRFFDSQHHRCCFSLCHAKIGTFVFCTWIFHEIVLGTIYLLTRLESGTQITSRLVILLVCRLIQLPSMALLYVGLWRHHSYLLLPFAVTQLTLGTFADISTLMMLLEDAELPAGSSSDAFPIPLRDPSVKWLNLVVPLFIYTLVMVALMWVLYRCFVYLNARSAHDEKRKLEKQQQVKMPLLSPPISPMPTMDDQEEMAPIRNPPLIQRAQSDRYANRAIRRSDASLQNMASTAGEKAATSPPELPVPEGVVSTKNGTRISFSDTVAISAEPN